MAMKLSKSSLARHVKEYNSVDRDNIVFKKKFSKWHGFHNWPRNGVKPSSHSELYVLLGNKFENLHTNKEMQRI